MNRVIPVVNWFVCWPCREYFKTAKAYANHDCPNGGKKATSHDYDNTQSVQNALPEILEQNEVKEESYSYDENANIIQPEIDRDFTEMATLTPVEVEIDQNAIHQTREINSVTRRLHNYHLRKKAIQNIYVDCNDNQIELEEEEKFIKPEKPEFKPKPPKCNFTTNKQANNKETKSSMNQEKDFKYKCNDCGKSLSTTYNLSIHRRIHNGEKRFACDLCTRSFKKSCDLKRHRRIHTGEKPYACDICEKSFAQSYGLVLHKRLHSGETPFGCQTCGKMFVKKSDLVRHERTHTGEKPFVCEFCGQAYAQTYGLVVHRRSHTGEQPWSCRICDKSFSRKSFLTSHEKRHHEGKETANPSSSKKKTSVKT